MNKVKEKLKKYPTSNEKLWYLNSSVMNYEGQGFDNIFQKMILISY